MLLPATGNRLGAPVPSTAPSTSTAAAVPGAFPSSTNSAHSSSSAPAAEEKKATSFSVVDSEPTTSIQIRLGDGTRMVAKVNLSHTVGDIRGFINAYVGALLSRVNDMI